MFGYALSESNKQPNCDHPVHVLCAASVVSHTRSKPLRLCLPVNSSFFPPPSVVRQILITLLEFDLVPTNQSLHRLPGLPGCCPFKNLLHCAKRPMFPSNFSSSRSKLV
mmetsp:Transcript_8259/g.28982  ORF Transcript_8259/g.28982 Transcript_8259/m.28982 type:complete len:109 (+) Transcript_8259:2188-2514(+)